MPNKISDLVSKYKKIKEDQRKKDYETIAKYIVGYKTLKHVVFHLPKAYNEKKHDNNSANKSVADYIDEPDFDFQEEVERISEKIEEKDKFIKDKVNTVKKAYNIINPLYWIFVLGKKIVHHVQNRKTKKLNSPEEKNESNNPIETNNSKQNDERKNFLNDLRKGVEPTTKIDINTNTNAELMKENKETVQKGFEIGE